MGYLKSSEWPAEINVTAEIRRNETSQDFNNSPTSENVVQIVFSMRHETRDCV